MSRENVELARWAFSSDPTRFFSLLDGTSSWTPGITWSCPELRSPAAGER